MRGCAERRLLPLAHERREKEKAYLIGRLDLQEDRVCRTRCRGPPKTPPSMRGPVQAVTGRERVVPLVVQLMKPHANRYRVDMGPRAIRRRDRVRVASLLNAFSQPNLASTVGHLEAHAAIA